VLIALLALFLAAKLRYSGRVAVKLPAADCNADLWKHIDHPERLRVIEACTAVAGRVVSLYRAADGDLHIGLDPEQKSTLNLINVMHAQRRLVVEVICDHPATNPEDALACAGFASSVTLASVGDHVRITGAYVTDRDNGWNEVHPVSRIEVLR
jgi:hypothetical protein